MAKQIGFARSEWSCLVLGANDDLALAAAHHSNAAADIMMQSHSRFSLLQPVDPLQQLSTGAPFLLEPKIQKRTFSLRSRP
jgi:hypothetical protein